MQHHQQHHDERGAQRDALRGIGFVGAGTIRAPQREAEQHQHEGSERQAELDRELQHQVVRVVEERDRPIGERRQRPREIEVAPADAQPWVRGDQRQRVGPDREARTRDVALAELRVAAEQVMAVMRPRREADPQQREEHRRGDQARPRAARQARIGHAPEAENQHADHAGARRAQHDARHQQHTERKRHAPPDAPLLDEPQQRDERPQQQAAQMIRLAQVARGAAVADARDHRAIGPLRREDLHQADQRTDHAGREQRDAQRLECRPRMARAHHGRAGDDDEHRRRDRADRRQRQRPRQRGPQRRHGRRQRKQRERRQQRAQPAAPRARQRQARHGRQHQHPRAPADEGRGLVEERRRRRQVVRDQRRQRDGDAARPRSSSRATPAAGQVSKSSALDRVRTRRGRSSGCSAHTGADCAAGCFAAGACRSIEAKC